MASGDIPLDWGSLTQDDIGGDDEFGTDDILKMGLSAFRAASGGGGVISTIQNMQNWALGQLPNLISMEGSSEMGIGFGAEGIGDSGGDLAALNTADEFGLGDAIGILAEI